MTVRDRKKKRKNRCRSRKSECPGRKLPLLLAVVLVLCFDTGYEFSAEAMELGGFDLNIGDDITDGWWSETGSSGENSVEYDPADTGSQKADTDTQKADTGSQKVDTDTQKADTDTQKADTGSQKADTDTQKTDAVSQKTDTGMRKAGTGTQKADTGSQKAGTGTQKADTGSQKAGTDTQKADTGSQRETIGSQKGSGDSEVSGHADVEESRESKKTESEYLIAESADPEDGNKLVYFSRSDCREFKEETMGLSYYQETIEAACEKGTCLLLSSETVLFPLSVRVNGRECDWQERENGIILRLPMKNDTYFIEAVLLYSAGESEPLVRYSMKLYDMI